ncbi:MAG: hypothetical protein A3H69_04395 [Candidatus Sungbacteria bacterium RIFCSPLOWO2_02_FULL_47_9]|uniref:Fimbrial assembly protein n=1 Tax=Candidatus Sungbacteria bacterium RIFCSPHIGHO2_01_FULL_47_32 TaxID=1802264 RepID=A0A1G2K9D2_9BACT|nr:MAG: hypothetical protein UX72_C0005G0058 [Parcubacteria group bacterium GW2011_GWA2_47_10]OGZ95995.1 MAG: hypothetical protein A2633_01565 [Candidatus Sungbacteria bacterium RIFCSPHIGHO2_01_FULL_47_32]OGZ98110.1 MAG: hypothetical protein A3D57_00545 [Candidatus Sungbacteria bacterium RIFCSPHIGHO2_02_FULL_46_12]OHA06082.1 MAG: hypothetical protein A3A28_03545 [Candidatus Sungbacteria bacterium RIFCSPLOWO2_01_FULL_47_32]OHA11880.1 MAG: hypothetical protein A3H69_04395 [Candidatus Sungbacteria
MFNLNLLSEAQKQEIRFEIYNRFLIRVGIDLGGIFLVFSVLLFPTFTFLVSQESVLKDQLDIEQDAQKSVLSDGFEKTLAEKNALIGALTKAESQSKDVTPLVLDVVLQAGSGVTIGEFHYDASGKNVKLGGGAETIKQFLDFKDRLSKLSYFSDIISPPENLVRFKDVKYNLDLKLK